MKETRVIEVVELVCDICPQDSPHRILSDEIIDRRFDIPTALAKFANGRWTVLPSGAAVCPDRNETVRTRFKHSPAGEQYAERDGERFTILDVIAEPDEDHDEDVLPMIRIRFDSDQTEIESWPEEVFHM